MGALSRGLKDRNKAEVVVCPPLVYLSALKKNLPFKLGAQDCFWEEKGAFTGEVSPVMLRDLKVRYVIVGHSERRLLRGESDEMVSQKLRAVLKAGLSPIFCIGETAEEREKGMAFKLLEKQIRQGLKKVLKSQIEKVVIAYEPIWAIGSGKPCSPDDALTAALFIRKMLGKVFSKKAAKNIRVLYGGSVNPQNAASYLTGNWVQGLLVGGTSLEPREFLEIVRIA